MTGTTRKRSVWTLAKAQHNVVRHDQLAGRGYTRHAIAHRVRIGRLFVVHRGVYSVGTPHLTRHGQLIAATFACGSNAALSHESAAELWEMIRGQTNPIDVSVLQRSSSRDGIKVHHRNELESTTHQGIRVTTAAQTLIDLAAAGFPRLEAAINEADSST